uniref:(northern house mosquito) hypothetical protein n=2 Tax=Culex pipiens TaxID=7175 RepID=A0A8D8FXE8_CULPI
MLRNDRNLRIREAVFGVARVDVFEDGPRRRQQLFLPLIVQRAVVVEPVDQGDARVQLLDLLPDVQLELVHRALLFCWSVGEPGNLPGARGNTEPESVVRDRYRGVIDAVLLILMKRTRPKIETSAQKKNPLHTPTPTQQTKTISLSIFLSTLLRFRFPSTLFRPKIIQTPKQITLFLYHTASTRSAT